MKHRLLTGLLAGAAALALTATTALPAVAGPLTPNRARYAALGDSFAAGVGSSTAEAYPALLAGRLNKVTFAAASGATTADVLAQARQVKPNAQQVTLTVGGNDIGFADVALTCALTPPQCGGAIAQASAKVPAMTQGLVAAITAVRAKAPGATVYVTGYPMLFQPTIGTTGLTCAALPGQNPVALAAADEAVASVNVAIVHVATATGATYVDVMGEFDGHGLCAGPGSYLNPPIPTGPGSFDPASLHPNAAGQAAYARALDEAGFVSAAGR